MTSMAAKRQIASDTHFQRNVRRTRIALIVGVLALWEFLPRAGVIDELSLVPFSSAAREAVRLFVSGEILADVFSTLGMVLLSFVIAAVAGLVLGFGLWNLPSLYRLISPYLTSYYALPIVVFYPTLVAIFGLSSTPVVVIAVSWAIVAVIVSTVAGLNAVAPVHLKTAAVYRLGAWHQMVRVYIPAAAPLIFNGLRLAAGYSIIGVVAAEFVLAPGGGLGYVVKYSYNNFQVLKMYAVVLIIIALAMSLTTLVSRIERSVVERRSS